MQHTHEGKINGGRIPYAPKTITSRSQNRYGKNDTRPTVNNLKQSLLSKGGQKYRLTSSGSLVRA